MAKASRTPKETDPVKFTRERLTEIGNVWADFAKAKVSPYVDKTQQWVKQRIETFKPPTAAEAAAETPGDPAG